MGFEWIHLPGTGNQKSHRFTSELVPSPTRGLISLTNSFSEGLYSQVFRLDAQSISTGAPPELHGRGHGYRLENGTSHLRPELVQAPTKTGVLDQGHGTRASTGQG
ncbi:hypothetical protein RHGRI_001622 [Rhododendron griersonianum]|uniref:Uncharacterized protein n=1 Tax=Rhododendron griersonianum TaxID=479676 RepID=A0AAV6LP04_9ERIC|nr:hypothetical protein RHGRI_001622 [Rhododendron griersonianum]